jgi:Domain of unknown function (DUF4381)
MTESATSLERLHDIVLPAAVQWWPPAPGWYVLLSLLLLGIAAAAWRGLQRWRANAYRRAALRELTALQDAAAIAALLRRTALAFTPRGRVAARDGIAWTDWLDAHMQKPMAADVRQLLAVGVYRQPDHREIERLREFARRWIASHRRCDRSSK